MNSQSNSIFLPPDHFIVCTEFLCKRKVRLVLFNASFYRDTTDAVKTGNVNSAVKRQY